MTKTEALNQKGLPAPNAKRGGHEMNLNRLNEGYFEILCDAWQVESLTEAVAALDTRDEESEIRQIAESLTDVYTADLLQWYQYDHSRLTYVDEAMEELGDAPIFDLLMAGQQIFHQNCLENLINKLRSEAENA